MVTACWSVKGGSGATVVACALALLHARTQPTLLVDVAGDADSALGLPEASQRGVLDWLSSPPDVASLADLWGSERVVAPHLDLLSAGGSAFAEPSVDAGRIEELSLALSRDPRAVVVDCGTIARRDSPGMALAASATLSLLVLRPCYLALRRAALAPVRPSAVVLVDEPNRALGRDDVEAVLGVPVRAVVRADPAIARAVDAGLLARRLPTALQRALRQAA